MYNSGGVCSNSPKQSLLQQSLGLLQQEFLFRRLQPALGVRLEIASVRKHCVFFQLEDSCFQLRDAATLARKLNLLCFSFY